ncbi:DUF397 domain-containing protein [Micromonospora sp. LOL_023]
MLVRVSKDRAGGTLACAPAAWPALVTHTPSAVR